MAHDCPTCDKGGFQSQHGLNIHHSKVHGESLTKIPVECEWCGEEKIISPSREDKDRHFCDRGCYDAWTRNERVGELTPRWAGRVEIECDWCGSNFEVTPNDAEDRRFCSKDCMYEWLSEFRKGEEHHQYDREVVECDECGEGFECYPFESDRRRFCSNECKGAAFRGEGHPHWNGGKVYYYGENWHSQREKAMQRDGGECRVCGMGRDEHREKHGEDLHVHHVKKIGKFDKPEDANELYNLVTLCEPHHDEWEGVPVAPEG